jgi:hypothetical protein
MLDQIAFCKEQERGIVDEIEAIEQKHKMMRQQNRLKQAVPPQELTNSLPFQQRQRVQPPKNDSALRLVGWLWVWDKLFGSKDSHQGPSTP